MMFQLQIQKLDERATLPSRGTSDAAGYDLYALNGGAIDPHSRVIVKTGIAIAIPYLNPPFYVYGSIRSRSGLSAKYGLEVGAGVIDYGYRGEVKVVLHNHSDLEYTYQPGDRIAQLVLEVHVLPNVVEVEQLNNTERGGGGFGSTGV